MLRARFVWASVEQPAQEVLSEIAVPFRQEDARLLSPLAQEDRLQAFLKEDRVLGFDLDQAPLLRLTLFQWGDESFTFVWTFHHAILDGRTFAPLLREVFGAYAELETGAIAARPAPPVYRRYIDWLQHQDFTAAEKFWKEHWLALLRRRRWWLTGIRHPDEPIYQQGEA